MALVGIVTTGVANLASVRAAFTRLGIETDLIEQPNKILSSEYLFLPGVGTFGAAAMQLNQHNLTGALRERISLRQPTLAICAGMQLFFDSSDESPNTQGLGIIPAHVEKINAPGLAIPQMGWNNVAPLNDFSAFQDGYAYFANSYAFPAIEIPGWKTAVFDYGGKYTAALQSGNVLACQFHPELSGTWGQAVIQNWLKAASC